MKTMLLYLKPYYKKISFGFVIKALGTLSELMLPMILSYVLKSVIGKSVTDILLWGGIMILFAALACIFNVWANRIAARTSSSFAETMRKDYFKRFYAFPLRKRINLPSRHLNHVSQQTPIMCTASSA